MVMLNALDYSNSDYGDGNSGEGGGEGGNAGPVVLPKGYEDYAPVSSPSTSTPSTAPTNPSITPPRPAPPSPSPATARSTPTPASAPASTSSSSSPSSVTASVPAPAPAPAPGSSNLAPQQWADVVLADPTGASLQQLLAGQTPRDKQLYMQTMGEITKRGFSPPSKGTGSERDRLVAANSAIAIANNMNDIYKKWKDRGIDINGPVSGTMDTFLNNNLHGVGVGTFVPSEHESEFRKDVAKFGDYRTLLAGQEARAALGRANQAYVDSIMKVLPDLGSTDDKFEGSIAAAKQRAASIRSTVLRNVWGSKIPDAAMQFNDVDPSIANSLGTANTANTGNTGAGPKQLDANTAAQFLKQAGGDPNKARQLAKSAGFIF